MNINKIKYVVCINNEGYQASLELHKLYQVRAWQKNTQVAPMELITLICMEYYKQTAPLGLKEKQTTLQWRLELARLSPLEER